MQKQHVKLNVVEEGRSKMVIWWLLILRATLTVSLSRVARRRVIRWRLGSGSFIPGFEEQLIGA
jgi:hypothetical protein